MTGDRGGAPEADRATFAADRGVPEADRADRATPVAGRGIPEAGRADRATPVAGRGATRIGPEVVARISAEAARQVPGVHALVAVPARPHGVAVRLDDRAAAVDVDVVTWYGHNVLTVADAIREVVIDRVRVATGLAVREVTVTVDDVVVPGVDVPPPA
ncbi:Asp23/Gls24 family envelope stress response protein [Micromonospora costi]|uniref:Asp23/Gls24 family envelope stress response protein n=1 Tax=Micromonospora costi TaxID=1530042 RepID=UPI001319E88E|nr:Asp23/Gls24 family envelope stress response protein [Micromonospora costi]